MPTPLFCFIRTRSRVGHDVGRGIPLSFLPLPLFRLLVLGLDQSRKDESAYEHGAPRKAVFAVAQRVAEVASKESRLSPS